MTTNLQTLAVSHVTSVAPPSAGATSDPRRVTAWRVLRSEWIKVWSVRSTATMMLVVVAILIGLGALAASVSTGKVTTGNSGSGPGRFAADPFSVVMMGSTFAVLLVGTLGALVGSREFTSGMIRTSVSAVPHRLAVLGAKAVTLTVALLPAVVAGVLGAFWVGMAILSKGGAATVSLGEAGWAMVGTVGYLLGVGLLGLALGFLFRGIAGSIATLIGGLLILPGIIGALLPTSWSEVLKYLPSNAASSFDSVTVPTDMLSAGAGVAVFVAWLVIALGAAGYVFRRRDV